MRNVRMTTEIALLKRPGEEWQQIEVAVHPVEGIPLKTLQQLVGGYFEAIDVGPTSIIVNEEGRLLQLTPCIAVRRNGMPPLTLLGPVLIVGNAVNRRKEGIYAGIESTFIRSAMCSSIWLKLEDVPVRTRQAVAEERMRFAWVESTGTSSMIHPICDQVVGDKSL